MIRLKRFFWFLFLIGCISCSRREVFQIAIQPFENFSPSLSDSIKNTLTNIYSAKVYVYPKTKLPKSAFVNIKAPRYRADSLINILQEDKSDSIDFILGLTNADISTTKKDSQGVIKKPESKYKDWGVFGLGYRPGSSSIVSTYRIGHHSSARVLLRLKKICVHEVGHNLGLTHCTKNEYCVMRDAVESISTIDFVELKLCNTCKSKLNF